MTERMENTIRHIKSGVDVDPWAAEEVERVFKAVDEIRKEIDKLPSYLTEDGRRMVRKCRVLEIFDKHIDGKDKNV